MDINQINASRIGGLGQLNRQDKTQPSAGQVGKTFNEALESLNQSQTNSDQLIEKLAAGENVDIHQVMIATEQTDINFRIAMAIRDRLVEAYREVTRMTV